MISTLMFVFSLKVYCCCSFWQGRGKEAWPMGGARSSSDAETSMRAATKRTSAAVSEYTSGETIMAIMNSPYVGHR